MSSIFDRPQRATIANAEWRVSVELVRGDTVIESSSAPLRIGDAHFNDRKTPGRLQAVGLDIGKWIDDHAQKRARAEAAQKRASKR